jgi:hypothetical protein
MDNFRRLPDELYEFNQYLWDKKISEKIDFFENLNSKLENVQSYNEQRYKSIFKNGKKLNAIDYIYKDSIEKKYYNDYLQSTYRTIIDCISETNTYIESHIEVINNLEIYNFYRQLFRELVIYLSNLEHHLDREHGGYGFGLRNVANSSEIYYSTYSHLFNYIKHGTMIDIINRPIAAFIIRQALEIRIKNALGIYMILSAESLKPMKMYIDQLVDFSYSNSNITIPITKHEHMTIHKWTNNFIHAGQIPETFKIWYAMKTIEPMFRGSNDENGFNMFGAIKINKLYYESSMENEIRNYILKKNKELKSDDILIQKIDPEALLI